MSHPIRPIDTLIEQVPSFALCVACISPPPPPSFSRHGAAWFGVTSVHELADGKLFDCIVLGESALEILSDSLTVAQCLKHLTSNGIVMAALSSRDIEPMTAELEEALQRHRLVVLDTIAIDATRSSVFFARTTYDSFAHANQLAVANMPMRAIAVLDWLERRTRLSDEQIADTAMAKLGFVHQFVHSVEPRTREALLFHAQKHFHIAVHHWPQRPALYQQHSAIWRRFGNDDYAARLLRSIEHVKPNSKTREMLGACDPSKTIQPPAETCPQWSGLWSPRVLVLGHDCSDYGMDTLYDGLCQVLGSERVVEFPWKPTLHGQDKAATVSYPCWFDYPGVPRTSEQLESELREGKFDLIVFADFVQMNRRAETHRLLDAAGDVPVVVYDPWDDGSATQDEAREYLGGSAISAYFKREMLACIDYGPNSFPLPFGYPDRHVPREVSPTRSNELFWAGKRLFGTRSLYLDFLAELLGKSMDQKYAQEEYTRILGESRIGLSFFGFGFDTVRYWELAAHGCMVLAERPLIRIPFNFVEGESAVFFDDLPELEHELAYYLSHPDEADRIAHAGRQQFLEHHTTAARARQFLGRIEHYLSNQ